MTDDGPSLLEERKLKELKRIANALSTLARCVEVVPGTEFVDGRDRWHFNIEGVTWEQNR